MKELSYSSVLYDLLNSFLRELQGRRILVTAEQHVLLLKVFDRFRDSITSENLIDFISPVIATNVSQLKIIKECYDDFLIKYEQNVLTEETTAPGSGNAGQGKDDDGKTPTTGNYFGWIGPYLRIILPVVALMVVLFFIYFFWDKPEIRAHVRVRLSDIHEPVRFSAIDGFERESDVSKVKFLWDFGDGHTDTSGYEVEHIYAACEDYPVTLKLLPRSEGVAITSADTTFIVSVRERTLSIATDGIGDIVVGRSVRLQLIGKLKDSLSNISNTWRVNDTIVARDIEILDYRFTSPGQKVVKVTAYGARDCSSEALARFDVKGMTDAVELTVLTTQEGSMLGPSPEVRAGWIWMLVLISVVPVSIMILLKRNRDRKLHSFLNRLKGKNPPYELPFRNYDSKIENEKILLDAAKSLKRRNADQQLQLNIPRTIASTVESEGMLNLVFSTKTRPAEYLFLIDSSETKSQQPKLFDYLLKVFRQNEIYFERFYFDSTPEICYTTPTQRIHVSRLVDLYPDHLVVILGTGHQFIDNDYPSLKESLVKHFRKWERWAICTPVCFRDWTHREKTLQLATTVVPADPQGLLVLFEAMESGSGNYVERLAENKGYSLAGVDFQDVDSLMKYLEDPFLFQWVCALAVYPRIHWSLLVTTGALIAKKYRDRDVNYSALLKIVRIPWMRKGSFPDGLRFELLKKLKPINEKAVRENVLHLVEEVSRKVDERSFAFEHLEIQRVTNKFILSSLDDRRNTPDYKQARDLFKALWEDNKIWDLPLKTYLQKRGDWTTLIGNSKLENSPNASKRVSTFLRDWKTLTLSRKVVSSMLSILAILVLGLILFSAEAIRSLPYTDLLYKENADERVDVTFELASNDCFDSIRMVRDQTKVTVIAPGSPEQQLSMANPRVTIPIAITDLDSVHWMLASNAARSAHDSVMSVLRPTVSFSIKGCPPQICDEWVRADIRTTSERLSEITGIYYEESIATGRDVSYAPVEIDEAKMLGMEIIEAFTCSSDPQMMKLTLYDGVNYQVAGILTEADGKLSVALSDEKYTAVGDARNDEGRFLFGRYIPLPRSYEEDADVIEMLKDLNGNYRGRSPLTLHDDKLFYENQSYHIFQVGRDTTGFPFPIYVLWMEMDYSSSRGPGLSESPFRFVSDGGGEIYRVYLMPVSDTHLFVGDVISDGENPGVLSIFKHEEDVELPASLNGAWTGRTSKRKIEFDIADETVSYNIDGTNNAELGIWSVLSMNDKTLKVILYDDAKRYRVLFLRNIGRGSFDLSVCSPRYRSLTEIDRVDNTNCDPFDTMRRPAVTPSLNESPPNNSEQQRRDSVVGNQNFKRDSVVENRNFKMEQLNFARVKKAYADKERIINDYFANSKIDKAGFNLFIRVFKREMKVEAWVKEKGSPVYQLLQTYDMCATSGTVGPKRRPGDLQIPEGVYWIERFDPASTFYLSLEINYPNQADVIRNGPGDSGAPIYIYGSCLNIGSIPIGYDRIEELYILAVEATNYGQRNIPVHIFPARLDELDAVFALFKGKDDRAFDFWENLKTVYDEFEKTRMVSPVKVDSRGLYVIGE